MSFIFTMSTACHERNRNMPGECCQGLLWLDCGETFLGDFVGREEKMSLTASVSVLIGLRMAHSFLRDVVLQNT